MNSIDVLEPLFAPLAALQNLIEAFDNRGIVIGGVAVSILGKPRLTADADAMFLLPAKKIPELIEQASREGIVPRIPDVEEFARRNRVVLLRHEESGVDIDISLGLLPFEVEAVERSREYDTGSLTVRLPTPEDLIILKAVAHRPKDMTDIATVLNAHDDLDTERIIFWVQQFAELLEIPEVLTELEDIIRR